LPPRPRTVAEEGSNPERKRERFLSPEELGRLGDALATAEEKGVNPLAILAIRLLALTGSFPPSEPPAPVRLQASGPSQGPSTCRL
jgi:hypothetical protein